MPSYEFYRSGFGGTDLDPAEFERYAKQAALVLQGYRRCYQLEPVAEQAQEEAVCCLAEALSYFDWLENGGAATGVSVGSVSQKGASLPRLTPARKSRELYRAASRYFNIYRGGGAAFCDG